MRYRFRREYRLKSQKQIQSLSRSRRKRADRILFIRYAENGLDYPRIAISVRRKDYPRAVERNRLKRIIREMFRINWFQWKGKDYLICVRLMQKPVSAPRIHQSLHKLLDT